MNGQRVNIKISDCAGNATTQQLVEHYIEKADCVLLCYSLTSHRSFENLDDWLEEIQKTDKGEKAPIALVATKLDLAISQRAVDPWKLTKKEAATKNCFISREITAWEDRTDYVNDLFQKVAE